MDKNKVGGIALISLFALSLVVSLFLIIARGRTQQADREVKKLDRRSMLTAGTAMGPNSVAVLNIFAPIQYESEDARFGLRRGGAIYWLDLLKSFEDNPAKALVIRMNTPGGTIGATQELYNMVKRLRAKGKIVVVSVSDLCASGGYYIATAADYIVANPGALTGSIGVILSGGWDLSDFFAKYGIRYNVIKSGKYKDSGAFYRKMSDEERAVLEEMVMDAYGQFFDAVAEGRKIEKTKLRKYADGRMLTARQAVDAGLVDELGDFEDAVRIAAEKAGIKGTPVPVELRPDMKKMFQFFTANYDRMLPVQSTSVQLVESPLELKGNYSPLMYFYTY